MFIVAPWIVSGRGRRGEGRQGERNVNRRQILRIFDMIEAEIKRRRRGRADSGKELKKKPCRVDEWGRS